MKDENLFDPTILQLGSLHVRWYGIMYLLGFMASFALVKYQIKAKNLVIKKETISDLFFYLILGVILGGRLGYVLIYNSPFFLQNPFEIIAVWHGGMSFHGGLLGTVLGGILFCRKNKLNFWEIADLIIVTVPIGLGLGRIGNFINSELYGRPTNLPWGIVFSDGGNISRHPSQLYEFFLEGVVLFFILWHLKDKTRIKGELLCLFLIFYSVFRFFVEFTREPDTQIGFIFGFITMGQILSLIMGGIGLFILNSIKKNKERMGI